jgi:GcrA cell cycle regulator
MNWTDERVELLRKLWADGLSASQIAAQMGGVSRNAVIGKVHRLKLSGRGKQTSSQPRVKKSTASGGGTRVSSAPRQSSSGPRVSSHTHSIGATALKADYEVRAVSATVLEFVPALVAPEPKRIKLVELSERTCKWPIGDPLAQDFAFCGHESGDSGPYCQFHAKLAYQPASERRRVR